MKQAKCIESVCVYSKSGEGKTTQIEFFSKVVRERLGEDKVVRLASANADGWSVIQPAVDMGWIAPLWVPARPYPIQTFDRLTQGWWPENPSDPASPLLPPAKQKDWGRVGGIAFDSGTDYADIVMRYMLAREAEPRSTFRAAAQAAANIYKDGAAEDETGYAAAAMGHYGSDQNRIDQFVNQSKNLEGKYILWTFLEDKGKDPVTKAAVYAPDVIGSALNGKVPSWFGRTVRLAVYGLGAQKKRRMYLHNHYEPGDPVPYLANVRDHWMAPLPDFLENEAANLYELYKRLDKSYADAKAKMQPKPTANVAIKS